MTTTPQPPDEPLLPDDVWEKFENDSLASIRATAPKEPSARARMVTARFREEEEEAVRRGAAERARPKQSYRDRRRTERVRRELRVEPARKGPRDWERPRRTGFLDRFRVPIVIVLTLAVGALVLNPLGVLSGLGMGGGSSGDGSSTVSTPTPEPPGGTAPGDPSAGTPIPSGRAFPDRLVRLGSGAEYRRVTTATTDDCRGAVTPELGALMARGDGCAQVTSALYTDAERATQITVSVLTFRRAEDVAAVLAKTSTDPVDHQVLPLDPPAGSGLTRLTPRTPGVFQGGNAGRSVVLATGMPSDGRLKDPEELGRLGGELLDYVQRKVNAYQGSGGDGRTEEPSAAV